MCDHKKPELVFSGVQSCWMFLSPELHVKQIKTEIFACPICNHMQTIVTICGFDLVNHCEYVRHIAGGFD